MGRKETEHLVDELKAYFLIEGRNDMELKDHNPDVPPWLLALPDDCHEHHETDMPDPPRFRQVGNRNCVKSLYSEPKLDRVEQDPR